MTMEATPEVVALARHLLTYPEGQPWSLQGFGMLRCDIDGREYRLHVWDHRFRVADVASIHDHPWDLESLVLSGAITNVLYTERDSFDLHANPHYATHYRNVIEPGDVGGQLDPPRLTDLREESRTVYGPGDVYSQTGEQIHDTLFLTGTVTLVRRTNRVTEGRGGDRARVYWPKTGPDHWVEATPQEATPEKVRSICEVALAMWGQHVVGQS